MEDVILSLLPATNWSFKSKPLCLLRQDSISHAANFSEIECCPLHSTEILGLCKVLIELQNKDYATDIELRISRNLRALSKWFHLINKVTNPVKNVHLLFSLHSSDNDLIKGGE